MMIRRLKTFNAKFKKSMTIRERQFIVGNNIAEDGSLEQSSKMDKVV